MGGIKKVIYLVEVFFNERDYDRFGIRTMLDNGFEVEVWDFTPLLAPGDYLDSRTDGFEGWPGYRIFADRASALSAFSRIDSSCFLVSCLHYNHKTFAFYRRISVNKVPYCVLSFGLPISSTAGDVFVRRLKRISLARLGPRLFRMIPFELLGIRPADIIVTQSNKCMAYGFPVNKNSTVLWTHSFDYDIYLAERNNPVVTEDRTAVFLDDYLPLHPDYAYLGYAPEITAEEYYSLMRNFFEYMEASFNIQIIVAAHPRSDYEGHPEYFGPRPVIKGKTAELVRKARFVLLHNSTSINFAVLYKKPMIFLTADKIEGSRIEDPSIKWLASFFGKKAHNLDESPDIDLGQELCIDENAYSLYKNNYIKKDGSEEKPFWQIVADRFRQWESACPAGCAQGNR